MADTDRSGAGQFRLPVDIPVQYLCIREWGPSANACRGHSVFLGRLEVHDYHR